MGQRSQVIIKVPAVFYNENNPNNHTEYIIVYHNQWFYGELFPWFIREFHKQLNKYLNYREKEQFLIKYPIDWEELIMKIMMTINYQNITAHTRFSVYYQKEEYAKLLKKHGCYNIQSFLNLFDNDNGFIYLEPDENGNLQYDILSGTENTDFIMRVTAEEYVKLFTEKPEKETIKNIEYIKKNCKETNITKIWLSEYIEQYEIFGKEIKEETK